MYYTAMYNWINTTSTFGQRYNYMKKHAEKLLLGSTPLTVLYMAGSRIFSRGGKLHFDDIGKILVFDS